ncbi:sensor histidine kinase [Nocardia sp. NPDC051052]|uniref:sensor histidine kinase n=1 Tax=Nocardia sp. NPDC051052 TaxID=3364322 RepID=UPI00378EE9D5
MRVRLLTAFTLLAAICMTCLAVGIGFQIVCSRTRGLLIDRIHDAERFVALSAGQPSTLGAEAQRYHDRTGNGVLVTGADGTLLCDIGVDRRDPAVIEASGRAKRFVPEGQPPWVYPWSTQSMLVAEPIGAPPEAGGVVVIVVSTFATRTQIGDAWIQLGCVTATGVLLVGGLALVMSGWILRPVSELLRNVDALTSTMPVRNAEPRGHAPKGEGPPEIVELAVGVRALTQAVAELAAAERRLVADTAHSMRNPLTALAVRLQALQPMMAADRAASAFVSVVGEVDRLTGLLDGLLASAVAEAGLGCAEATSAASGCDAVRVAGQRVEAWHDAFTEAGLTLTMRPLVTTAESVVPHQVLTQILDVALSNSARYAGRGAAATVIVNHECESVVISVQDTGIGVAPDEIDRITTRFFRGAQAAAGGSGLGLPIAATLAAQHGGLFFVEAVEPHGLAVTVSFPTVSGPAGIDETARLR